MDSVPFRRGTTARSLKVGGKGHVSLVVFWFIFVDLVQFCSQICMAGRQLHEPALRERQIGDFGVRHRTACSWSWVQMVLNIKVHERPRAGHIVAHFSRPQLDVQ